MSLHENFRQPEHTGFTRSVDPHSARRQLHVSLGVVGALAVAILVSAGAIHPSTGYDSSSQSASLSSASALSRTHVNAQAIALRWYRG